MHAFVTHGDDGKNIGPLKEHQEESDRIKMRNHSKDAGIDFTCELQHEEMTMLVRHRHFAMHFPTHQLPIIRYCVPI